VVTVPLPERNNLRVADGFTLTSDLSSLTSLL
jgi:hypothetical protein